MKLALTGGGTGGHIFPALAVLQALQRQASDVDVCFFGPANRGEREMVESGGLGFVEVPAAGLRGRGPVGLVRSTWSVLSGIVTAIGCVREFRPDVVFSTGGYGSFPMSVAAKLLRRPLVVYLPDVRPGWAVRVERLLATRMTTTTDAALAHLPAKKTVVTGYPVRETFFKLSRAEARAALGLTGGRPVVLIAGASQGARAINAAVFAALPDLCGRADVFHVTGTAGEPAALEERRKLPPGLQGCYHPAAFRGDLPELMLAADLGVFRAGASILGEVPAAALPAILIPGTFAGGHQSQNAQWLEQAGAASIVEEPELGSLGARIRALLDAPDQLDAMRAAARALARPDAASAIAAVLLEVARK